MPTPKPKKAGRPPFPEGNATVGTLRVRVTPDGLKKLAAAAKAKKHTVSEFIRGTLSAALEFYQLLQARLDNLQKIIDNPEVYF